MRAQGACTDVATCVLMLVVDPRIVDLGPVLSAVPTVPVWYFTNHSGLFGAHHPRVRYLPTPARTWQDYNRVLRSAWFWRQLPVPYALLFERDSFFCKHPTFSLPFFLREMVEYRYVLMGAPWRDEHWWCRLKGRCVGNSGLSLLNVDSVVQLLPNRSDTAYKLDSSLHRRAVAAHLPLPPNEIAEKFSMESTRRAAWFTPFGCHKRRCCESW